MQKRDLIFYRLELKTRIFFFLIKFSQKTINFLHVEFELSYNAKFKNTHAFKFIYSTC